MKTTVVRYKTRADQGDANAALIAQVFEALSRTQPAGLNYRVMRAKDGVTFTHVATVEGSPVEHPLTSLPEFKAFSAGIRERCEEPPVALDCDVIGSYAG